MYKILFLNTGANHNLGDRAMLLNVVRLVREQLPSSELIVDAGVPDWMIQEFRLTPVSTMMNCWGRAAEMLKSLYAFVAVSLMRVLLLRHTYRFLPSHSMEHELLSAIDRCDLIWMVGGGYLNDLGATEARAILCTAWLGQRMGIPVVMTGQGIGPFTSVWTRRLFRTVAANAKSMILREPSTGTQEILSLGDLRIQWSVGVDDASSLPSRANQLSPPAFLALHFSRSSFHSDGVHIERNILHLLRYLIARGKRIKLFIFSERPSYALEIYEEWKHLSADKEAIEIIQNSDPRQILAELRTCQCAIGVAYHFHLFALLSGIPSLAMYSGMYYESKYKGIDIIFDQSKSFVNYSSVNDTFLIDFVNSNNKISKPHLSAFLQAKADTIQRMATKQILDTLVVLGHQEH